MEMFTITTAGYVPFTLNLHASLAPLGLADQLVVYSLDDRAHRALLRAGVRSVRHGEGPGRPWTAWGTVEYMVTTTYKYSIAMDILKTGRQAFYVDGDIVFLRDPVEHLQRAMAASSADIVAQFQSPKHMYGAGFWLAGPTSRARDTLMHVWETLQTDKYIDDEGVFSTRLFETSLVTACPLDPDLFPCGNRFLVSEEKRRSYPDTGGRPFDRDAAYILHFTHAVGKEAKVKAMIAHRAVFHTGLARHRFPGPGAMLTRVPGAVVRRTRAALSAAMTRVRRP